MDWLSRYRACHQHPLNRATHALGIPAVLVSLPALWWDWKVAAFLFVGGWILQFVGHAMEGKPPAFFSDIRFLFVGVLWWFISFFRRDRK